MVYENRIPQTSDAPCGSSTKPYGSTMKPRFYASTLIFLLTLALTTSVWAQQAVTPDTVTSTGEGWKLIVPKRHIATLNDLQSEDDALVGRMHRCAARLAQDRGQHEAGYRTVFNTNSSAGQTVFHIHLHLLAGRRLSWPPG